MKLNLDNSCLNLFHFVAYMVKYINYLLVPLQAFLAVKLFRI